MIAANCIELTLQSETVLLHPQRALLWPARRTLIVADPHFAKDDIFRRSGIALPRGPAIADLQRLTALIEDNAVERLAILGDFLHGATRARDSFLHAFQVWRRAHAQLSIDIVAGNHDRHEAAARWTTMANWHVRPLVEPPFVYAHHPGAHPDGFVLAGHIHPVVKLSRASGAGRVPVFWLRPQCLVLPSFGTFTGGANIHAGPGDKLFAAGSERVVPLVR